MKRWLSLLVAAGLALGSWTGPAAFARAEAMPAIADQLYTGVFGNGTAGSTQLPMVASYTGALGVQIRSYSAKWTSQQQLQAVYDELLRNVHGPEISKLSVVNLYPDGSGGLYHGQWGTRGGERIYQGDRVIDLFGVDRSDSVADLARTLAHEYGHHFTMYYLWMNEGRTFDEPDWREAGWVKLRNLAEHTEVSPDSDEHAWLPSEIAAEDYAQLFGSPLALASTPFSEATTYYSNDMHNLAPQENLALPLAAEVAGLRQYWLTLSGVPVPSDLPPTPPRLQTAGEERVNGRRHIRFRWSAAADPERQPVEYTLVSYDDPLDLAYGHITLTEETSVSVPVSMTDRRTFRIFAKDNAGSVVSSNTLTLELSQRVAASPDLPAPTIPVTPAPPDPSARLPLPEWVQIYRPGTVLPVRATDLPRTHWAAGAIDLVAAAGWMRGYPDATFKPDSAVSRAEFLTLLSRAMPLSSGPLASPFADVPGHYWAYDMIHRARYLGLTDSVTSRFEPDRAITRAEMALLLGKFLYRGRMDALSACAEEQAGFPDVEGRLVADAAEAIHCMAHHGIVKGLPDGTYAPERSLTRAEAATILSRLFR